VSDRQEIVRAAGADLATRLDGAAGAPWIVLSNGLASTYESWDAQIDALTRTHRVLRYDTRGHGRSSAPPGPYSFADLTGDMVALMDHYGIEDADLMGLSMGGMTMLGMAIDHPSRTRRVVCCDARADAAPAFVASWDARIAAIRDGGGMGAIVETTLERWFTADFRERKPSAIGAAAAMILATSPEGYIGCATALKRLDYKRSLGRIAAPVLYVCGAQDQAAPPAVMREMAQLTPAATFEPVDPGAHACNVENAVRFNQVVGDWLQGTQA
jgi:3-oxoadipate enol-lactonase